MIRPGRIGAGLVFMLVVAALAPAACGHPWDVVPQRAMEIQPGWASCDVGAGPVPEPAADAIELPHLSDEFLPVGAVVCDAQIERRTDGIEILVATEGRTDEINALLAALRLPDEPRSRRPCTMHQILVKWLALLDADGRWVRPGLPTDGCGQIRIEVREAIDALKLTQVAKRTLREIE